jgi:hypothetical protein
MKLGKTARIILIVGAFIVAFFVVNQMKEEAESEQYSLNVQLELTRLLLPKLAADKEALGEQLVLLENDLAEAAASLEESRAEFPADIQSIEYDEVLFNIAHEWDLHHHASGQAGRAVPGRSGGVPHLYLSDRSRHTELL